jgi:hypothetical protein
VRWRFCGGTVWKVGWGRSVDIENEIGYHGLRGDISSVEVVIKYSSNVIEC